MAVDVEDMSEPQPMSGSRLNSKPGLCDRFHRRFASAVGFEHARFMLYTDSIHAPTPSRAGGLRILATRYRGRFVKKSAYDIWMPNLGPSESLLKQIKGGSITWAQFQKAYQREMSGVDTPERGNRTIKNHGQKFTLRLLALLATREDITLLCHCTREETRCHRHVLARLIEKSGQ
jgi:uncharacterized protein YeaO (DUF488 family)